MTSKHVIYGMETTHCFVIQNQMHMCQNKRLKMKIVLILMKNYDVFWEFCQPADFLSEQIFCRTDSSGAPDFRLVWHYSDTDCKKKTRINSKGIYYHIDFQASYAISETESRISTRWAPATKTKSFLKAIDTKRNSTYVLMVCLHLLIESNLKTF